MQLQRPRPGANEVIAMHALVVEDSRTMQTLLSAALAKLGFSARVAGDASAAVQCLHDADPSLTGGAGTGSEPADSSWIPDLVLVDHNLPGASGLQLVRMLRNRRGTAKVKILMVSAEGHRVFIDQALTAGVDEYLFKPFTRDALASKIALLGLLPPRPAHQPGPQRVAICDGSR